jgi:1-acyl-sn-glycerol-3-phosphate acyltransferase
VIRTAWVWLNALISTPLLSLLVIMGSFAGASGRFYERIGRFWVRWLLRASGVRVVAFGLENIAPGRPQIILCNHVSWYDVGALTNVVPKRYRFVGKQELARVPLWGRAWQAAGSIAIDRSDTQAAIASLDRAARLVRADSSTIIIFPEGTRSPDGTLQLFKKGAFMLALHSGIEVVPAVVIGTRDILPKGSWRVRPGRIIVRFGAPIPVGAGSQSDRDELMARTRREMQALLDAPLP